MHIVKEGLSFEDYKYLSRLEAKYYDASHIASAEESFEWAQKYPWTEAVLLDEEQGDRVAGFLDLFPIAPSLYEKIAGGAYNDADLLASDVLDLNTAVPGNYPMFLCCVIIEEEYRRTDALKLLLRHQVQVYKEYEKKGFRFDRVITDNVTESGKRFSQRLGFLKVTDTLHDSVIYAGNYDEFVRRIENL